jgi:hypothetical protein
MLIESIAKYDKARPGLLKKCKSTHCEFYRPGSEGNNTPFCAAYAKAIWQLEVCEKFKEKV